MKQISFKPHTADVRMVVKASSIEELFLAAMEGMISFMDPDISADSATTNFDIDITSMDESGLLVDFLSEMLSIMHIKKIVFTGNEMFVIKDNSARGIFLGNPVLRFKRDIKAVTHHEVYVRKKRNGNWEAQLIFDI